MIIMGIRKKMKALIKDDRPAKLKSFLSTQDVDPCEILFSKGRNPLHYCSEFGSVDMMRCLLRLECDPLHQDKDGRLPLHTALYRCLEERSVAATKEIYEGMVQLLLSAGPMGQDVEDKDDVTCHDLIKRVKARLKHAQRTGHQHNNLPVEDEIEWQRKLASESQFEFEEQLPRYSSYTEDYSDKDGPESFSSWSDRLSREYREKRRAQDLRGQQTNPRKRSGFSSSSSQETHSKKLKDEQPDPDEKLRRAREEMKKNYRPPPVDKITNINVSSNIKHEQLLSQKDRYEKRFNKFFSHPPPHGSVSFAGIPWPCTNMDKLIDTLFCDLSDKESPEYKKFLRRERVRWHPDKFAQKFSDFLHPDHKDKILTRVKHISQTLNSKAK